MVRILASIPLVCGIVSSAAAKEITVTMDGMEYRPATVQAAVGDTIRFVNDDSMQHAVFVPSTAHALDLGAGARGRTAVAAAGAGTVRGGMCLPSRDASCRGGEVMHTRIITVFVLGGFSATMLLAGPERVALPEDYQSRFVNYLDVDHHQRDRVRRMYVNPEADAAAAAGEELPDGTVLIMEDHDVELGADGEPVFDEAGRMIATAPVVNIFVMEKNEAWETANGHWDYAWYQSDGTPNPDAQFDGCFSCHASRAERDFTFTYWKHVSDRAE